ncbi:MAG: radical SAM family heme chaperone HemW [Chloroflexi bacterium]|nr:radical SAM family heme chaperone HemW [Chloroflexota bacterium]
MPQRPYAPGSVTSGVHLPESPLALYYHIPFCQIRCTYCAFNTYTRLESLIPGYAEALIRETRLVAGSARRPAVTIYFGGGTPSLIPPRLIAPLLDACAEVFDLAPDVEITLEANPGTTDRAYLQELRAIGVNRLSVGMQSAHARELHLFARGHGVDEVRETVTLARAAGFENISLDLIYGVPQQTLDMWQTSLETALDIGPDHLSMYSLGLEDGTPMQRWVERGHLPAPDSDLAADMYEWADERLARAGFEQYEISNWARPGLACRHNLHYWRSLPYLGLGAGAHGYAGGKRTVTVLHPAHYIERIQQQPAPLPYPASAATDTIEPIDARQAMVETMMMGLRLVQEGVALSTFRAWFGRDLWEVYGAELDRLIAFGLVELPTADQVRLTPRGRLLGNHVFAEFIQE